MKVTVKNFGPIGEAKDIRLSPMTLFVGPSNTGKSYLAVLLYAIVDILADNKRYMRLRSADQKFASKGANFVKLAPKSGEEVSVEFKRKLNALAREEFTFWAQNISEEWRRKILYCFGEEGEHLFKEEGMSAVLRSDDGAVSVDLRSPKHSAISDDAQFAAGMNFIDAYKKQTEQQDISEDLAIEMLLFEGAFANDFRSALWRDASDAAHYLPAIRGGIMQSHHGLVDATMRQAPFAGLSSVVLPQIRVAPMFNGVLSDFIRKLIDLRGDKFLAPWRRVRRAGSRRTDSCKEIISIGKQMESGIMQGTIEENKSETGYPDFRYKFSRGGGARTLSLRNTSSMVSELAPVSIFVRHHLGKGDLFIVEEPEAHLHPDGQRGISDILVHLANAGVFVLATTHSDIVLEQVSNSAHRAKSGAKKGAAKGRGASLDLDKAAVYSFASRTKGRTKVKNVKFDATTGFMTSDHLQASTDLYNESVKLLNAARDD